MMPALDWLGMAWLDATAVEYAVLVGVLAPILAVRTRRRLAAPDAPTGPALRRRVIPGQVFLLAASLYVGLTHGLQPARTPQATALWLVALPALALIEAARWVAWHTATVEEKRSMWVRQFLPERHELAGWTALTALAAVTEEIAYRAVLFAVLYRATNSLIAAALLMSVSFGIAHAVQGRRGQIMIAFIGLVLQGLVLVTGSLFPAMAVHFAANMVAGIRGPARFRRLDETASSTP